ncbi:hypothetical protein LguiB_016008 [Lonicera macranthoides]
MATPLNPTVSFWRESLLLKMLGIFWSFFFSFFFLFSFFPFLLFFLLFLPISSSPFNQFSSSSDLFFSFQSVLPFFFFFFFFFFSFFRSVLLFSFFFFFFLFFSASVLSTVLSPEQKDHLGFFTMLPAVTNERQSARLRITLEQSTAGAGAAWWASEAELVKAQMARRRVRVILGIDILWGEK